MAPDLRKRKVGGLRPSVPCRIRVGWFPASIEMGTNHLEVVSSAMLVDRQPVQVIIDGREFDLDGAHDLIAALTELVEAVEEGTPPASESVSTAIVAVVHDEAARQGIELSIPDPPTVDELKAAADALGMLPSDIARKAEEARQG